jgi:hypothetical protein
MRDPEEATEFKLGDHKAVRLIYQDSEDRRRNRSGEAAVPAVTEDELDSARVRAFEALDVLTAETVRGREGDGIRHPGCTADVLHHVALEHRPSLMSLPGVSR